MPIFKTAAIMFLPKFRLVALFCLIGASSLAQIPRLSSYTSAKATVYLDFDGQLVKGSAWNWDGDISAKPSGLSSQQITDIFHRVSEDFRIFNINITTDLNVYSRAPIGKRVRIIVTPTYQWYGHAGGVAFVNSFSWGDETPAWVFSSLLNNDSKYIAEATSHEIGHTLGLQHQSTYNRNCELMAEYAEGRGSGEISWAPIMGVGYYRNYTTWTFGSSIEGCKVTQNDILIISKGLNLIGLRGDDHGNTKSTATPLSIINNRFALTALINNAPDKDVFKIQLIRKSRMTAQGIPVNRGTGNSGANIDMMLVLMRATGDTILKVNPKMLLSASIDTVLNAGTYYIGVDGINNQNVSDYGSVGMYNLTGTVVPTTSSSAVVISGVSKEDLHMLSWQVQDKESITRSYLEYSLDGNYFVPVSKFPVNSNTYTNKPVRRGNMFYRLRMVLPDETSFYSNTLLLTKGAVSLLSNMITDQVQVSASSNYTYQIIDETGRVFQTGRVSAGINTIDVNTVKSGVLMMKVFNPVEHYAFKLIKH